MIFNQKRKDEITVTKLSGCPRSVFIDRHFDHYAYPSNCFWAFRGSVFHLLLEQAQIHPDAIKEQRFERAWEGITISGTPDLIIPSQKTIKDWKTTKSVPSYRNKDGIINAYENHRTQLNLYRWLVPHKISELEVVYFSMEETLICPVEIWPDKPQKRADITVNRYFEERLIPLKMALNSGTMPAYSPTWSCNGYCSVSEICHRELKKEIMAARRVMELKEGGDKDVSTAANRKRAAATDAPAVHHG